MKSLFKPILLLLLTSILFSCNQKQSFIGLWEVEKVSMGDQSMTPIAKWAKYNEDGTYESGNGWLKSIDGKYSFDKLTSSISSEDFLGIKDEMGAFTVSYEGQKMIWKRTESGNEVTVTFKKITELPMSPSDYLEGVWIRDGEKLHFRWDRIIVFYDSENQKSSGYWHINGHRPEITLLPHSQEKPVESWKITVNEKELTMIGVSDSNKDVVKVFSRTNTL